MPKSLQFKLSKFFGLVLFNEFTENSIIIQKQKTWPREGAVHIRSEPAALRGIQGSEKVPDQGAVAQPNLERNREGARQARRNRTELQQGWKGHVRKNVQL